MSQVQSERSKRVKINGLEPNWTVIRLKVDIPSDESKYQSGRSESVKVDDLKVSSQMVRKCQTDLKCTRNLRALILTQSEII